MACFLVPDEWANFSISEAADLLRFSHTAVCRVYTECQKNERHLLRNKSSENVRVGSI